MQNSGYLLNVLKYITYLPTYFVLRRVCIIGHYDNSINPINCIIKPKEQYPLTAFNCNKFHSNIFTLLNTHAICLMKTWWINVVGFHLRQRIGIHSFSTPPWLCPESENLLCCACAITQSNMLHSSRSQTCFLGLLEGVQMDFFSYQFNWLWWKVAPGINFTLLQQHKECALRKW